MATQIEQLQDDQILVNGKMVHKDSSNNWVQSEELTVTEQKHLRQHLEKTKTGLCG